MEIHIQGKVHLKSNLSYLYLEQMGENYSGGLYKEKQNLLESLDTELNLLKEQEHRSE